MLCPFAERRIVTWLLEMVWSVHESLVEAEELCCMVVWMGRRQVLKAVFD